MTRIRTVVAAVVLLVCSAVHAKADVVLTWNGIAVATLVSQGQSPFAQARYLSITQLAVFEAVNAVTKEYEPYLGTVVAAAGASAEAAAVTAAYRVLKTYFPANATLDPAYAVSMAAIPDGPAKVNGVATGESAAAQMTALRASDGSAPPAFYQPVSADAGVWQLTSSPLCLASGGVNFQWQNMTPFGVESAPGDKAWIDQFRPVPPPAITSNLYAKDYNEVMTVGSMTSTERPQDRTNVARIYAASSPGLVFNLAARQIATAQGRSLSENARALALINMASNDALVVSFEAKYHYQLWRPETAIRADSDDNPKTDPDMSYAPLITTPCFPSYPSNHASGSNSAAEVLRRLYGAGGHAIEIESPAVPGVVLKYTTIKQITDDIDDARVYGGIHFRFDQVAGGQLGREVATYVYKHNLRKTNKNNN